jgi:hypothetical protein
MLVHEVRRCNSDVLNSASASVIQVINRPANRGSSFDIQRLQALTTRYCTYYSINPLWIQHKSRLAMYFHRFVVLLGPFVAALPVRLTERVSKHASTRFRKNPINHRLMCMLTTHDAPMLFKRKLSDRRYHDYHLQSRSMTHSIASTDLPKVLLFSKTNRRNFICYDDAKLECLKFHRPRSRVFQRTSLAPCT